MSGFARTVLCSTAVLLAACSYGQPYEQSHLGAADNWMFRKTYPRADQLFNAFDYGHAVLSETLLRDPARAAARLEGVRFAVPRRTSTA